MHSFPYIYLIHSIDNLSANLGDLNSSGPYGWNSQAMPPTVLWHASTYSIEIYSLSNAMAHASEVDHVKEFNKKYKQVLKLPCLNRAG